ncbi:MAG TPA: hypothetical protein VK212_05035 [Lentimicrobium sp.]|nr:hypothetical protein [Lentimicrobium sp.]
MTSNSTFNSKIRNLVILLMAVGLTSCLTVEKKQYTYQLTGNNSGKLTIKYINIYSIMDDGKDVSQSDFQELVDKYLNGTQIMEDFPAASNIKTRLFEENDQLCGEITLDFNDLNSARLYQYSKGCPIMMNISTAFDSETYISSNGEYGNDHMPVVFWPTDAKKMVVTTLVSTPDETSTSMLDDYKEWADSK